MAEVRSWRVGAGRVARWAALCGAFAGGCAGEPGFRARERLRASEFVDPAVPPAVMPVEEAPEPEPPARARVRVITPSEAREGIGEVTADPADASGDGEADGGVGGPQNTWTPTPATLVDARVGDLNGRPIYAREWLEPMGDRLREEGRRRGRADWRRFAAQEISQRLNTELQEELLLAEARSALTPEQKQGLRNFLDQLERRAVSSSGGSRTRAEQRAQEQFGQSLTEVRREQERIALLRDQFENKIWNRVQVPWRDIELEYERASDVYNPPPSAVFRLIRVRGDEPEAIEAVRAALESGEQFEEAAALEVNMSPDPVRVTLPEDGSLEGVEVSGNPLLQEAAMGLSPGEWTGPIESGPFRYWMAFEQVEHKSVPLYEAQREIRSELVDRGRGEEQVRYISRLYQRAGVGDFSELVIRLVDIAERWYRPSLAPEAEERGESGDAGGHTGDNSDDRGERAPE